MQLCVSMATHVRVLLTAWLNVCVAMNLDTLFPLLKKGENGSLFGLSVALHHHLKTDTYLWVYTCFTHTCVCECKREREIERERIPLVHQGKRILSYVTNQYTKVDTHAHRWIRWIKQIWWIRWITLQVDHFPEKISELGLRFDSNWWGGFRFLAPFCLLPKSLSGPPAAFLHYHHDNHSFLFSNWILTHTHTHTVIWFCVWSHMNSAVSLLMVLLVAVMLLLSYQKILDVCGFTWAAGCSHMTSRLFVIVCVLVLISVCLISDRLQLPLQVSIFGPKHFSMT